MNVLVVTRDFPPRINGGISTAVGYEVDGLVAAGVNCTVVSFDDWRPASGRPDDRVCPHIFTGKPGQPTIYRLSGPTALRRTVELAVESKPDVIHLHQAMLIDFALDVAGGRVPIIQTLHVLQHHMNTFRRVADTQSSLAEARGLERSDVLIVLSAAELCRLAQEFPHLASKTTVIPPGVPDRPTAAASVWPRPAGPAVYAGRFGDIKGTNALFEIARRIVAGDPAASVVIAGGLPDSQASERRYMRKWATEAGGADVSRVAFPGWLTPAQLGDMFSRASLYMCPSLFETFGLAPAEAMLHQLPVVAFRCGGVEAMIDDGVNGVLVEPGEIDAFAAACTGLLRDPGRRAAMGRAARSTILSRFDVDAHTRAIIGAYGRLAAGI